MIRCGCLVGVGQTALDPQHLASIGAEASEQKVGATPQGQVAH
jgi:hypothetical protein